jgi:hypothetical protein
MGMRTVKDKDVMDASTGRPITYYLSTNILGQLFKAIDEKAIWLCAADRPSVQNDKTFWSDFIDACAWDIKDFKELNWQGYRQKAQDIRSE